MGKWLPSVPASGPFLQAKSHEEAPPQQGVFWLKEGVEWNTYERHPWETPEALRSRAREASGYKGSTQPRVPAPVLP